MWLESAFPVRVRAVRRKPEYRKVFGETLRDHRKRAGLTIEELAEKADLHPNFIGEVERANMEISLTSMRKIAKALGIRIRDLVAGL